MASHKAKCSRIITHVRSVISELTAWNKRLEKDEWPQILHQVEQLNGYAVSRKLKQNAMKLMFVRSFENILGSMKCLADPERDYFSRFVGQNDDASIIQQCEKELEYAMRLFTVLSNMLSSFNASLMMIHSRKPAWKPTRLHRRLSSKEKNGVTRCSWRRKNP